MNPCGSGQRLVRNGRYGEDGWGVTDEAHDWSYGRKGFPLYCTHCAFMNELGPINWIGYPVYPSHPPDDFEEDPAFGTGTRTRRTSPRSTGGGTGWS